MVIGEGWEPRPPSYDKEEEEKKPSAILSNIQKIKSDDNIFTENQGNKLETFNHFLRLEAAVTELHFDEMTESMMTKKNPNKQELSINKKKGLLLQKLREHSSLKDWNQNTFVADVELGKHFDRASLEKVGMAVRNFCTALDFAFQEKSLSIDMILQVHRRLLAEDERKEEMPKNIGCFRSGHVRTGWESTHSDPKEVETKLKGLVKCVKEEMSCTSAARSPYAIAAYFLYKFNVIHPFSDGNGRVARIMASSILCRLGLPFVISIWTAKYEKDFELFQCVKRKRKQHNSYLQQLSRSLGSDNYGGCLSYMFLISHYENLKRFVDFVSHDSQ